MKSRTKVLFLYTTPANYLYRCLKHLSLLPKVEIQVVFKNSSPLSLDIESENHPFVSATKPQDFKELLHLCLNFEPNIIFISGWMDRDYLQIGSIFRKNGISIIGLSDTPLKKNIRQYIGKWYARWFLQNIFSAFWVSGQRAEDLIRYLGWTNIPVFQGFYSADHGVFSPSYIQHKTPSFLFVGRLDKIKGIEILISAYQWYRSIVRNPWSLKIAGTGPLQNTLPNSAGIQYLGHLSYSKLATIYNQSACFILPSLHEPWGVVIHEAASAGLPLILSINCGAKERFLKPNVNGWIWENRDFKSLGALMTKVHFTSPSKLKLYGKRSYQLSLGISTQQWLNTFAAIKSL